MDGGVEGGLGGREGALGTLKSSLHGRQPLPEGLWVSPVTLTRHPRAGDSPTRGPSKFQRCW